MPPRFRAMDTHNSSSSPSVQDGAEAAGKPEVADNSQFNITVNPGSQSSVAEDGE